MHCSKKKSIYYMQHELHAIFFLFFSFKSIAKIDNVHYALLITSKEFLLLNYSLCTPDILVIGQVFKNENNIFSTEKLWHDHRVINPLFFPEFPTYDFAT